MIGDDAALASDAKRDCLVDVVKYGVYHTPKQFLVRAHQRRLPCGCSEVWGIPYPKAVSGPCPEFLVRAHHG